MQHNRAYIAFARRAVGAARTAEPIFVRDVADEIARERGLALSDASAAAACAFSRLMGSGEFPELRRWRRGIYYRTVSTPFGERPIDRGAVFRRRYLDGDRGYETADGAANAMGLTTQVPAVRTFATNATRSRRRVEGFAGFEIVPPRTEVNEGNKAYLQTLDVLELLDRLPVDAADPYALLVAHIEQRGLSYRMLLELAEAHYGPRCVSALCRVACRRLEDEREAA